MEAGCRVNLGMLILLPALLLLLLQITPVGSTAPVTEADEKTCGGADGTNGADSTCKADEEARCDVPRVHVSDMTLERFRNEFYLRSPVIVTGVGTLPDAKATGWTVNELVSNFGNTTVKVGSSRTITKTYGSGHAQAKLGDLVSTIASRPSSDIYAFDQQSLVFTEAPHLIDGIRSTAARVFGPRYEFSSELNTSSYSYFFSLGGKSSGVHLHHHSDGISYLFAGRKRWFFRKPYTLPSITHMQLMSMDRWLRKWVYPHLSHDERPLECVQRAGELVYVPESWWHGTINNGKPFTLSFAAQLKRPETRNERRMLQGLEHKNRRRYKKAVSILRRLVKAVPEHTEAWYVLGIIYGRQRKKKGYLQKELDAKRKSVDLSNRRSCETMNNLGTALIHKKSYAEAEQVLQQVLNICPWHDLAWNNFATALHHQQKDDEAEAALQKGEALHRKWNSPINVTVGNATLAL